MTVGRGLGIFSYFSVALLAALPIAPAAADGLARAAGQRVELVDYKFKPGGIRLAAGKLVVLRLTNSAQQAHEFAAPEFFASATIRPGYAKFINKEGEVEVASGQHVDIALVPKAGAYHLRCNKPGHAALGMVGMIVVR
jgi:uncharacterized cupredoxin-like copper-binding protein